MRNKNLVYALSRKCIMVDSLILPYHIGKMFPPYLKYRTQASQVTNKKLLYLSFSLGIDVNTFVENKLNASIDTKPPHRYDRNPTAEVRRRHYTSWPSSGVTAIVQRSKSCLWSSAMIAGLVCRYFMNSTNTTREAHERHMLCILPIPILMVVQREA